MAIPDIAAKPQRVCRKCFPLGDHTGTVTSPPTSPSSPSRTVGGGKAGRDRAGSSDSDEGGPGTAQARMSVHGEWLRDLAMKLCRCTVEFNSTHRRHHCRLVKPTAAIAGYWLVVLS